MGFRGRLHSSNLESLMSALAQKRTFGPRKAMSALPPKANIGGVRMDVRFVPKADIMQCNKRSRPIAAGTVGFSPVGSEGCKAPAT
jgi:hypothetical protein